MVVKIDLKMEKDLVTFETSNKTGQSSCHQEI